MSIDITTPGGIRVDRSVSHKGFRDITLSDALEDAGDAEISVDEFLREEHHNYYGGPWSMGRYIFERMVDRGLKPQDDVLDLGCGAGRIGIWLIDYLEPGKYVGVDVHYRSLAAFARYEIPLHELENKEPRLVLDGEFRLSELGTKFDWICDCSVTAHLTTEQTVEAYTAMRNALRSQGRIVLHHTPKLNARDLAAMGFVLSHESPLPYPLMKGSKRWAPGTSNWSEITIST